MFFYVQGPNKHDLMPLERVFDRRLVNKIEAVKKSVKIDPELNYEKIQKRQQSSTATDIYQSINEPPGNRAVLFAYQVMTAPVETLMADMSIGHALTLFQARGFRYFPVVSTNGKVTGVVSDRDIFKYMSGIYKRYQKEDVVSKLSDKVEQIMQSPVLTASVKTDVRYIARLFVERRVGSMPVVSDGELKGLITRSDILHAVMSHYELELWI